MKLIRNAKYALQNPLILKDYSSYCCSLVVHSGQAIRKLHDVNVSGFVNFSEFKTCEQALSHGEFNFIRSYPFAAGPIVDVGANLGIVSLVLAKRFPERQIYSFEPGPTTRQALRSNVELNNCLNIQIYPVAVGAQDGEVSFDADPVKRATASIVSSNCDHMITVPCTKLDTFVAERRLEQISFLKVDVEGYESLVFRGAKKVLERTLASVIYYEVCPEVTERAGFDPLEPTKILKEHGYAIYKLDESGSMVEVADPDIMKVTLANWIAIAP